MKINIKPIIVGLRETADNVELFQGGYELGSNDACTVKVKYFSGNDIKVEEKITLPKELVEN
jgi:hypothetical protein